MNKLALLHSDVHAIKCGGFSKQYTQDNDSKVVVGIDPVSGEMSTFEPNEHRALSIAHPALSEYLATGESIQRALFCGLMPWINMEHPDLIMGENWDLKFITAVLFCGGLHVRSDWTDKCLRSLAVVADSRLLVKSFEWWDMVGMNIVGSHPHLAFALFPDHLNNKTCRIADLNKQIYVDFCY